MTSFAVYPDNGHRFLMDSVWTYANIVEPNTYGTVGCYGQDDVYYFYMEFVALNSDEWWLSTRNFVMLFQMGESNSRWAGLKLEITSDKTAGTQEALIPIWLTNSRKDAIETDGVADDASSVVDQAATENPYDDPESPIEPTINPFAGYVDFLPASGGGTPTSTMVYI